MTVEVIAPGFISVTPDVLDWRDVLVRARKLLEDHGWVKGTSGGKSEGFSLHGAIGQAAAELTEERDGKSAPLAKTLRDDAVQKLRPHMPSKYATETSPDIPWNDQQRSVKSLYGLIDKAIA